MSQFIRHLIGKEMAVGSAYLLPIKHIAGENAVEVNKRNHINTARYRPCSRSCSSSSFCLALKFLGTSTMIWA